MKISAFAFAALISAANADFSLRATASKLLGYDNQASSTAEARVVLHGMKHPATTKDLAIVQDTVIAAYNHAYQAAGYSLVSFHTELATTLPENIGLTQPDCTLCPPDDDFMEETGLVTNGQLVLASVQLGLKQPDCTLCPPDDDVISVEDLTMIHKTFEQTLCAGLRASKSNNFASVRDCSFSFLDMPGQPVTDLPVQHTSLPAGPTNEAQIMVHGLLRDISEADMVTMGKAAEAAYNQVFATLTGMTLAGVRMVANIDIPVDWNNWSQPDCTLCPPDDDKLKMASGESKLVVARVESFGWSQPDCTLCPPDDDAFLPITDDTLAVLHQAFENTFCKMLQKSGRHNLAAVHDCAFRFVHNAGVAAKEPTAAQF